MFVLLALTTLISHKSAVECTVRLADRAMHVEFRYPVSKAKAPTLHFDNWAGVANFGDDVSNFHALDASQHSLTVSHVSPNEWRINSKGKAFSITYDVTCPKTSHMGNARFGRFHPTLLSNYVFVWGHAWALRPEAGAFASYPVHVTFRPGAYKQGELSFGPTGTMDSLADSLLIAGDYRHTTISNDGRKLSIWTTGKWKYSDQEFVNAVAGIQKTQTKMMGFLPAGRLMIALIPGEQHSTGGTAVESAIGVYPSPDESLQDNGAATLKLIAHEHFHLWNGKLLHAKSGKAEGFYKTFEEGLTDYYALKTLLVDGTISPNQFLDQVNAAYERYQVNPHALLTDANTLAKHYWDDNDCTRLPYDKGVVVGLLLDIQMTHGLDSFVRRITSKGNPYDESSIVAAAESDRLREITKVELFGSQPVRPDELVPFGVDLEKATRATYELGIEIQDKRIKSVVSGSNAEKAGLKQGEEVKGYSYYSGEPTREALIQVERDGKIVDVKFMPFKQREIIQIRPTATTLKAIERISRPR